MLIRHYILVGKWSMTSFLFHFVSDTAKGCGLRFMWQKLIPLQKICLVVLVCSIQGTKITIPVPTFQQNYWDREQRSKGFWDVLIFMIYKANSTLTAHKHSFGCMAGVVMLWMCFLSGCHCLSWFTFHNFCPCDLVSNEREV